MSFKDFYQELTRGFPSNLYLISSYQDFILYETQNFIREKLKIEQSFNFSQYDFDSFEEKISISDIVDTLNTFPFLSTRRIVFLKNIQEAPKKELKNVEDYIKNPADFSLLFIFCKGDHRKVFAGEALLKMRVFNINLKEREIYTWCKEKAKSKNITITDEAIEYLLEVTGDELFMINSEIEKLTLIGKNEIGVADLKENIYLGREFNAFDLIRAIKDGDRGQVFKIYDNLKKNVEPYLLLGALNWHYKKLYERASKNEQLIYMEIFRLLHEADIGIKSSSPDVVDNLLIKILQIEGKVQSGGY